MKIPTCPACGNAKVILAPIKPGWNHQEAPCSSLPVYCTECSWNGTWKDVVYRT